MKRIVTYSALVVSLGLALGLGCLTKDTVVDIVVRSESTADFPHHSEGVSFSNTADVNIGKELDDALADAGVDKDKIQKVVFEALWYGVLSITSDNGFKVGGAITVERTDLAGAPVNLMLYDSVKIADALGQKRKAALLKPGIDLINQAAADWIAGGTPALRFTMNNASVTPAPTPLSPIDFKWRVWFKIDVVSSQDFSVIEPF